MENKRGVNPEEGREGANPSGGANKSEGATVSFVIDRERRQRGGIDPKKLLAELKTYSFPKDKDKITNLLSFIENEAFKVDSDNLMVLIENLAKWAREAREVRATGFLQQIASCARKMDALGESDIDIFFALWKIVPEIANSIGDCKKVITNVIDSHSDDFDIVISGLLPFFRKADNYQQLPEFFKVVFPEEDNNNNRDLVSSAWNTILCDKEINDILEKSRYFATPTGKEFARHIEKHSEGREIPKALTKYRKDSKARGIKMLGLGAAVIVVSLVVAIVAIIIAGNAIDPSSIVIDYPTEITLNWGEDIDLGGKIITYKSNNGAEHQVPLTDATVKGFDKYSVRTQTVTIEYKGKTHNVIVKVNPLVLSAPELKLSSGSIVWNSVAAEGKCKYFVKLTDTSGNSVGVTDGTVDGTAYVIPESLGIGSYKVTVTAKSNSAEYTDSSSVTLQFEKKEGVTNVRYEDGRIVWDALEGVGGYTVKLNDEELMANTNSLQRALKGGNNEITVGVVYDGNTVFKTTTVFVKKILTPVIQINGGVITADNANTKFYLNGVEFNKDDLDSLTVTPGEYKLTARVFATTAGEVDSDEFGPATIVRLPKPMLSIKNNALQIQEGYTAVYSLDGADFNFDGNILDLTTPKEYVVKAKFIAKTGEQYVLPSVESDAVSFTKLPTPTIKQDGSNITIENGYAQYELYVNGESYNGKIDSLPSGFYTITARNIGDGVNSISSAESNAAKVGKIRGAMINANVPPSSPNRLNLGIEMPDLDLSKYKVSFEVDIVFYEGDQEVSSIRDKMVTSMNWSEIIASNVDKVEIIVTVMYEGFEDIVLETKTWTKS